MLGKLLKHDFKSLLRRIWPAFLILFASAGLCRLFWRLGEAYPAFNLVRGLALTLFILLLVAGYLFVCVVCIMRFYQSMVKDEGYLTHTLPVTKGRLIFSKVFSCSPRTWPRPPLHSTSRRCSARCGPCSKPRLPMRDWALCGSCRCLHCAP